MTNEQLTQTVIDLVAYKAKAEEEHRMYDSILNEIQVDVKATKSLAEDVHIMAINMQNMQKTLEETNKKVDDLSSKEIEEYRDNKKLIKDKIIGAIAGSIGTAIVGAIVWFINKGGF